jgi:hypothetical protein
MERDERVQVRLEGTGLIASRLVCWVDREVKAGQFITLKDSPNPDFLWKVVSVGAPKKASEIKSNRTFNVGGLDNARFRK